jgi:hypothetical protein
LRKQPILHTAIILGVLLAALSLLFLPIWPWKGLLSDETLNLGHLPLFGLVAYLLLLLMRRKHGPGKGAFIGSLLGGLFLAAASEFAQTYTRRNADLRDFFHDVLGLVLVLGGVYVYRRRRLALTALYAVFALTSLGLALSPVTRLVLAAPKLVQAFPSLGSFEASWELAYWRAVGRSRVVRSQQVSSEGKWSLRVLCRPSPYPGTQITGFPKDWSSYRALRFDVYVPGSDTLKLYLRIDDRAVSGSRRHSLTRSYMLRPGWNKETLPMDDLAQAFGRAPGNVGRGIFFLADPKRSATFHLDNVALQWCP